MRVVYKGGRTWYEVVLNRKSYIFTKENNRTLDISDQAVINYIFSLPNRGEFSVLVEEKPQEKNPLICEVCGFIGKSDFGILAHKRKHK